MISKGSVTDWKAVGGAAVQGAITGGAAAATGGASLAVSATAKVAVVGASAVAANVAGGTANRTIQGQKTTLTDVAVDAAAGAVGAAAGAVVGKVVKAGMDKLSNAAKGKIGETATTVKYAAKGYIREGRATVPTGGTTPTGRQAVAVYDHEMKRVITGQTKTVESKFNYYGKESMEILSKNQKAAANLAPGGLVVDRTTGTQFGAVANGATQSAVTATANQVTKKER